MPRHDATGLLPETEYDSKVPGLHLRHGKRGSVWYLYYRLDGQQHRPKIGDARVITRPRAREIALGWLAEISQGRPHTEPRSKRTVNDLRVRYDEVHAPRKKASSRAADAFLWDRHILPRIGTRKVAAISKSDINELHFEMRSTPYQANRAIALLHKSFALAVAWDWRQDNPVIVERYRETKRRRVLSRDEAARLFQSLDAMRSAHPWFVAMVELMIFTGCRRGEIQTARWEWIRDDTLFLPDSKTGEKSVPLNQPALEALRSIPRIVGNPYVIAGTGRGHLKGHFKYWRKLLTAASIDGLRMHDLRRTFASVSLSSGVSLDQVGQVLGHASVQTTRGYAYLAQDAARAAAELTGSALSAMRKKTPA